MQDPTDRSARSGSVDRNAEPAMRVKVPRAQSDDAHELLDIWLRSVRATHAFLTVADISFLKPRVLDSSFRMRRSSTSSARTRERLAPEHLRRGLGTRLIAEARSLRPGTELTVDVNEQNTDARRFYEACGFVVEGRAASDGQGLPFPLLHMRAPAVA